MSPVNGNAAPVCPITRSQAVPGMPGRFMPYIARPTDLPSAIKAVNDIKKILELLTGGPPINNLFSAPTGDKNPRPDSGGGGGKKQKRWVEKKRITKKIKYYAMDAQGDRDEDNWIIIERIIYIKWHDRLQDIDFVFEWPYDQQDQFERNSQLLD